MSDEKPIFKFALREDLKDNPEFLPTQGEPLASGWDVKAALPPGVKSITINPKEYVKISLGIRAFCPDGWWLELRPRSSTFGKKYLHALYGVIDQTFEGELLFAAQFLPYSDNQKIGSYYTASNLVISHGEAIGQIIPVKRKEMEITSISNEEYDILCKERAGVRGSGGFGSTTKDIK